MDYNELIEIDGCSCCETGTKVLNNNDCCKDSSTVQKAKRQITIDFLYLDLSTCERCQGTDTTLDEALNDVENVLKLTGVDVIINKINVSTEELAYKHKFLSSPTIRVNGCDIQMEVKENTCDACGDLCGDDVDCRIWSYDGEEYEVPPKAMIIESILKMVYGNSNEIQVEQKYTIPTNLKLFYFAMDKKNKANLL